MQIMQVPEDGGVFAVDFESVERLVAARVTGGFKGRQRAVAEAGQESAGVVDAHLFHFAGELVFAFLDEGLGHGGDGVDAAVEPDGGVDAVREQIAGDAAARDFRIQAPEAGAALRKIGVEIVQSCRNLAR